MGCDMGFEQIAKCSSLEETHAAAAALGRLLGDGDAIALIGSLGAGKTSFAQGVGASLGVKEPMTSPTFNIVFEYDSGRIPLCHFDLYRLEGPSSLEDIDFHALADASTPGASIIEWADLFADEMPDDILEVQLGHASAAEDSTRIIGARATGPRSSELLSEWKGSLSNGS